MSHISISKIKNSYMTAGSKAENLSHAPFWGEKLSDVCHKSGVILA